MQPRAGLVLRRCGPPAFDRQRGQERLDLGCAELGRVAPAMKDDKALDPVAIGPFGADAVLPDPDPFADSLEQRDRRGFARAGGAGYLTR